MPESYIRRFSVGDHCGILTAKKPIVLTISDDDDDGWFVASDDFSIEYGDEGTVDEACINYAEAVAIMMEWIEEEGDAVDDRSRQRLEILREHWAFNSAYEQWHRYCVAEQMYRAAVGTVKMPAAEETSR